MPVDQTTAPTMRLNLRRAEWRPVVGFDGYEVSSRGDVASCATTECTPSRINGYSWVGLCSRGRHYNLPVHGLVCEAFHGKAPSPLHEAHHRNGQRSDNRPGNLVWLDHTTNLKMRGRYEDVPVTPRVAEEWREVPSFGGELEASSKGRIRKTQFWLLRCPIGTTGYRGVCLSSKPRRRNVVVHRLVAEAFVPPFGGGECIRHLDGNPLNNTPDNLAWGTHQENVDDRERHGRTARGVTSGMSKLTAENVAYIRESGLTKTYQQLADELGVDHTAVSCAARGETWAHLPGAITTTPPRDCRCSPKLMMTSHATKLTPASVLLARQEWHYGARLNDLVRRYGTTKSMMSLVVRRLTWRLV